jgi:glycosyltransferase involved in cell wall biosynthesis
MIVQHGIFPGFVAPIAKEWAKNLHRLGVDVSVANVGRRSPHGESEPLDFPVHAIDSSNVVHVYSELKKLLRNCDLVHYFPGKGLELMPLLNRRVKYIFNHISVSVTGVHSRDSLINSIKRWQPMFADMVLGTDEKLLNALRPVVRTPVELMPVGYAEDLFFPCPRVPQGSEKRLIYHGAVRPQRKLDRLIQVLSQLPQDYTLTIIGGGLRGDEEYRDHLAQVARKLNCLGRLELTNMPQAAIRQEIASAYLGLSYVPMLECFQDQFVLKTLEYLACQRPVMATATRYTREFSESIGPGRILLADDTVEDMVNKILGADKYVEGFYAPDILDSLSAFLLPFSSKHLVETRLLPIYKRLINRTS